MSHPELIGKLIENMLAEQIKQLEREYERKNKELEIEYSKRFTKNVRAYSTNVADTINEIQKCKREIIDASNKEEIDEITQEMVDLIHKFITILGNSIGNFLK